MDFQVREPASVVCAHVPKLKADTWMAPGVSEAGGSVCKSAARSLPGSPSSLENAHSARGSTSFLEVQLGGTSWLGGAAWLCGSHWPPLLQYTLNECVKSYVHHIPIKPDGPGLVLSFLSLSMAAMLFRVPALTQWDA